MGASHRAGKSESCAIANGGVKERRRLEGERCRRWRVIARQQRADRAIALSVSGAFLDRICAIPVRRFTEWGLTEFRAAACRNVVTPTVDPPADRVDQRVETGAEDAD